MSNHKSSPPPTPSAAATGLNGHRHAPTDSDNGQSHHLLNELSAAHSPPMKNGFANGHSDPIASGERGGPSASGEHHSDQPSASSSSSLHPRPRTRSRFTSHGDSEVPSTASPTASTSSRKYSIRETLRGRNLFLTGASGFLGKVLVEKILHSIPDVGKLYLLIRPSRGKSAAQRMEEEVSATHSGVRLPCIVLLHGCLPKKIKNNRSVSLVPNGQPSHREDFSCFHPETRSSEM